MPIIARGQITLSIVEHGVNALSIYKRTQFQPLVPSSSAIPEDWNVDPETFAENYGLLWRSSALKDKDGKLRGTWEKPILYEHYNSNMLWRFPWAAGSGSVHIYSQNGNAVENVREMGVTPFDTSDIIWKCIPDSGYPSKAGGFITTRCPINQKLSLRISCWAKQMADDGKLFFAAFPGGGTEIYEGDWRPDYNPYLWQGKLPTFNKWYLLVGYLYGCESEVTEADARAGIYDPVTGYKVMDFTYIYRNSSEATHNGMRMFYNSTTTASSQLHLWQPRVDVVDGREPSVEELLKKSKDGEKGEKGDGIVNVYRAHPKLPPQPAGSTSPPQGWSLSVPSGSPQVSNIVYDSEKLAQWETTSDGFWVTKYIEDDQSAKMSVEFNTTVSHQSIGIAIRVSCERMYDELHVSALDSETTVQTYSGEVDEILYMDIAQVGKHKLTFEYIKDSSASEGSDQAMVKVLPSIPLTTYLSVGTVKGGKVVHWTNPVQFIAKDGNTGRSVVYRGTFSASKKYYQDTKRVDVVKNNASYYLYCGQNGASGSWSTSNWEAFGGEFESVATSLLLAENANIADWIIKDGKISSQNELPSGKPTAVLDGTNGSVEFNSEVLRYTATGAEEYVEQNIHLDSQMGMVEVRNADNDVSYISSQGIFANRAGIQAIPSMMGIELKAAVVALGYGELNKTAYDSVGAICGVYADSTNNSSSPAPSWGAYIRKLRAVGLYLGVRRINSSTYLNAYDCFVSCYNTAACNVYLPSNPQEGQMIIISMLNKIFPTVYGNGKSMYVHRELVSSMSITEGGANSAMFVYNGQYWMNVYVSWF